MVEDVQSEEMPLFMSLDFFAGIFFRHKILCLAGVLLGVSIAAALYMRAPTVYRSEAMACNWPDALRTECESGTRRPAVCLNIFRLPQRRA